MRHHGGMAGGATAVVRAVVGHEHRSGFPYGGAARDDRDRARRIFGELPGHAALEYVLEPLRAAVPVTSSPARRSTASSRSVGTGRPSATVALVRMPCDAHTWKLWSRGAVVAVEVGCDVGEVAVLRALDDALFTGTAAAGEAPAGDDPPEGTPLVRVTFSGREGDDVLSVFADGRRVERTAAGKTSERRLGAQQLAAVRRALTATDRGALPSGLC